MAKIPPNFNSDSDSVENLKGRMALFNLNSYLESQVSDETRREILRLVETTITEYIYYTSSIAERAIKDYLTSLGLIAKE